MTDHIGLPIYWALLFYQTDSLGPQDADLQIQLKPKHHPTEGYIEQIRSAVHSQFPGVTIYLAGGGYHQPGTRILACRRRSTCRLSAAISNADYQHRAEAARPRWKPIPGAADVRIPQVLDYPTLRVNVDRDKALQLGITESATSPPAYSLRSARASLFSPNHWLDSKNGVNYNVAVQTPQHISQFAAGDR